MPSLPRPNECRRSQEPLSIVIPVRNRPRLIARCLDSIKAQTWRPLRVIVVDNASTDSTLAAVEEWAHNHKEPDLDVCILSEPTPGQAFARKTGVEAVRTRFMMHFDSDDTMRPRHIENVMQTLADNPEADLVAFRVERHFPDGKNAISHHASPENLAERHLVHSILTSLVYVCLTSLVRDAGSWDTSLPRWEDWELGVRLAEAARHPLIIDHIGVDVDCRADSVTGTEFTSKAGEWELAIDKVENTLLSIADPYRRRRLLPYAAYRRTVLAAHYAKEGGMRSPLAKTLLKKALSADYITTLQRLYLLATYHYTARGGRGAAIAAPLLFR